MQNGRYWQRVPGYDSNEGWHGRGHQHHHGGPCATRALSPYRNQPHVDERVHGARRSVVSPDPFSAFHDHQHHWTNAQPLTPTAPPPILDAYDSTLDPEVFWDSNGRPFIYLDSPPVDHYPDLGPNYRVASHSVFPRTRETAMNLHWTSQQWEQASLQRIERLAIEAQERQRREADEAERRVHEARDRERAQLLREAEAATSVEELRPVYDELRVAWAEVVIHMEKTLMLHKSVEARVETLGPEVRAQLGWDELFGPPISTHQSSAGETLPPLYGSNSNARAQSGAVATCVICTDEPAIQALVPCGHLCLCEDCSLRLMDTTSSAESLPSCPLCRTVVTSSLRIYRQDA